MTHNPSAAGSSPAGPTTYNGFLRDAHRFAHTCDHSPTPAEVDAAWDSLAPAERAERLEDALATIVAGGLAGSMSWFCADPAETLAKALLQAEIGRDRRVVAACAEEAGSVAPLGVTGLAVIGEGS